MARCVYCGPFKYDPGEDITKAVLNHSSGEVHESMRKLDNELRAAIFIPDGPPFATFTVGLPED